MAVHDWSACDVLMIIFSVINCDRGSSDMGSCFARRCVISDILLGVRDLEVIRVSPFLFAALIFIRGRDCHRNYVLRYLFISNTLTLSRILRTPSL